MIISRFPIANSSALLALVCLGAGLGTVSGQLLEADVQPDNALFQAGVPAGSGLSASPGQFGGVAPMSASVVPPSSTNPNDSKLYPDNGDSSVGRSATYVLQHAVVGYPLASGIPRYFMGEVIRPPLTSYDSNQDVGPGYWRPQPLLAGEVFDIVDSSGAPITNASLPTVQVLSASTQSTAVTLTGAIPAELQIGASLLGQPITNIVGENTVVLGGNANVTINSQTLVDLIPAVPFYYSRHAERVFASQPGLVEVLWITAQPFPGTSTYGTRRERFIVSAASTQEPQSIFWTEAGFDGPNVQITDGRILTANPIYNSFVPKAVAEEIDIPGTDNLTQNLKTLYFEKLNGIGNLRAYNVEGRLLVEYLGDVREGNDVHHFVGLEVVDVKRVPSVYQKPVNLGVQILPHTEEASLNEPPKTPELFAVPTQTTLINGSHHYGINILPNGTQTYYAEEISGNPKVPENGEPESEDAYNKVVFYWMKSAQFNIQWPQFKNRYWLRWSPVLEDYAQHMVGPDGSEPGTGISFSRGDLPQIVYQDDPAQIEASLNLTTQDFEVSFAPGSDRLNRTLLKFSSPDDFWYVNVYTQWEGRARDYDYSDFSLSGDRLELTLTSGASLSGLEVGMLLTHPNTGFVHEIVGFKDASTLLLGTALPVEVSSGTLRFLVEPDGELPIVENIAVGDRIEAPEGHEIGGYVSQGRGYHPDAYIDPFVNGIESGNQGAIIPVNVRPGDSSIVVRWFREFSHPTGAFAKFFVPGKLGTYNLNWPSSSSTITIAEGVGTGDLLGPLAAASVYVENDPAAIGYNPNEEHCFVIGGRAYAMRDDLNVVSQDASYTSEPFVLLSYTNPEDNRPEMKAYSVNQGDFRYSAVAGTLLNRPYPLPLMPLPLADDGSGNLVSKDVEIFPTDTPLNLADEIQNDPFYEEFTFQDRKGFTWVHRGPHDGQSAYEISMKLYYPSRASFFIPGLGEPEVGTVLPFLRQNHGRRSGSLLNLAEIDSGANHEPLTVKFVPEWPENPARLRVGETLTLPKFGLPQVRGQKSVSVAYQQSLALAAAGSSETSVVLHDPTREKTYALDEVFDSLPASLATNSYRGKTHFQNLPAHLQERFLFDPLRGSKGTLVLLGEFHDGAAGEDYLDLNVLSDGDLAVLKALVADSDVQKNLWDDAIDQLTTTVEPFVESSQQAGSYVPDVVNSFEVGPQAPALINDPDIAVDSYALTASGKGAGWVTMIFGDGEAFTPEGDPVQVQVFKVEEQLYVGDLKVVYSNNPLNEQVTLRHSGDFAARPQDYEFEWKWATGAATAPQTYATTFSETLDNVSNWSLIADPNRQRPPFGNFGGVLPFPRSVNVRPVGYSEADEAAGFPSLVLKPEQTVDFASEVPGEIVFTADVGGLDGFVLYVNDVEALAYQAPVEHFVSLNAATGLVTNGLPLQFRVPREFFRVGANTLQVAMYSQADTGTNSNLEFSLFTSSETDLVTAATTEWQTRSDPMGKNTNFAIVGGSPENPFGGPQFVLNDRWFTVRYRPKDGTGNIMEGEWSRWMSPMLVEGWVKRVLAAINPFQQRISNLFENSVNTDVSVLTQAGARWEGDIALTLDNIDEVGLIEIYETLLNRARAMSIDANVNDPDSNTALLLAAGYLNDLYTLLGNEAFADAANPTISLETSGGASEVNTSRFSFESQVASSLEEELALLRGRDDLVSPGVRTAPAYNRLYWNYTRGVDSGEVIYATNYNVREQAGSDTADGVIDEEDAQRMFPQGHGDAYGHFLTALSGYYELLRSPNFSWIPRAEAVTVLGQPVTIDYQDERKFAAAAANLGRTAEQILNLTFRQNYKDDPEAGWQHFRDQTPVNTQTNIRRSQGLDEWVSRSAQGNLYHWVMGNAMVPAEDLVNQGIQKIDRTTVPELALLVTQATTFQTTIDNANAHLNPLGLSPYAVAFDISPLDLKNGQGHFEQIYERSLNALNNAAGAFNQAAVMTRSLRTQENQLDEYNTELFQQEEAYKEQLIEIYGQPYDGDVGVGKLYAQGYDGPDLVNWFIVDRPSGLSDVGASFDIPVLQPVSQDFAFLSGTYRGASYDDSSLVLSLFNLGVDSLLDPSASNLVDNSVEGLSAAADLYLRNDSAGTYTKLSIEDYQEVGVTVSPSQFVQYHDTWQEGGLGARPETGELQEALLDAQATWLQLADFNGGFQDSMKDFENAVNLFQETLILHQLRFNEMRADHEQQLIAATVTSAMEFTRETVEVLGEEVEDTAEAVAEALPTSVGFSTDATAPARGAIELTGAIISAVSAAAEITLNAAIRSYEIYDLKLGFDMEEMMAVLDFDQEARGVAYDLQATYKELIGNRDHISGLVLEHHRALQRVKNVLAKGNRLLAERELFRIRAASVIQGYRTNDVSFRLFRNEALEQYRSLFDLASRYSYLAAKSYDYETGLLGTEQGREVFSDLVSARSLGDLTGGVPQATTSTIGDSGLAGTMARLAADYSVAEGRLGINNPDQNGTVFSLRSELFRILRDDSQTDDDQLWQQVLEQHIVNDLRLDEDVAALCSNIERGDGGAVPGIVIPFGTNIEHGENFFGLPLAGGDHAYSASNFATKIYSVGVSLPGYVGMDIHSGGGIEAIGAGDGGADALSATPYLYLIPCGQDVMLAPPLGNTGERRQWFVEDQALPLPYNLGASDFNANQFFNANGTLSEQPWIIRRHQAFRAVNDVAVFYSRIPEEFGSSRLIGRSVWNTKWKLVIPAYTLLNDEEEGLDRFVGTVSDIQLFLRTYSNSGN